MRTMEIRRSSTKNSNFGRLAVFDRRDAHFAAEVRLPFAWRHFFVFFDNDFLIARQCEHG